MTHDSINNLSQRGQYWLGHIQQWRKSNTTQCEYCRNRDISVTAFRWWRRQLIRKGIDLSQACDSNAAQSSSGPFVEVSFTRRTAGRDSVVYEIVLLNQRRLCLAEGFDPDAVAALVSILEPRC